MKRFQVGDKVRCIDGTPIKDLDKNNEGIVTFADSDFVKFAGEDSSGWYHRRFELVEKHDDTWIPWSGGECPVPKGTLVGYRLRDDNFSSLPVHEADATYLRWNHLGSGGDIMSYRVKTLPKVSYDEAVEKIRNKTATAVAGVSSGVASAIRRKRVLLLT